MTLKLRLPGRFRRARGTPNASASGEASTSAKTLSVASSSSSCSSSYQQRLPLPVLVTSNVESETASSSSIAKCTAATCTASECRPPANDPPVSLPHLPNLVTTSTIIAHGTQPLAAATDKTSRDRRPTLERGGNAGGSACSHRSSWRSTSLGSMRSINEDAELPSDDDADFWDSGARNTCIIDGRIDAESSESRFPLLSSHRTPSNSSLTSVQSCPAATRTASSISASNKNTGSSSPSKRDLREEKIRRKNFEARRREFATGNPRRLSNDGSVSSAGSACSGEDPALIRRKRQSVDFLRQESQAAAISGDDDDCYYCRHGEQCLDNYRPRSPSLDDSSDQRVLVEHSATSAGQRRRATMPSDFMSASQTLVDSYYRDHEHSSSIDELDEEDPCTWNDTATSGDIRRPSMPISITEGEGDEVWEGGDYHSSRSNVNESRNGGNIGLLEELEGRGLLRVQNAGLAGSLLYYDTEHRRLSL